MLQPPFNNVVYPEVCRWPRVGTQAIVFLKQSIININCFCLAYTITFNLNFENISSVFFKISLLEL